MNGNRPIRSWEPQVITCPECDAHFKFRRSHAPEIDSCGFESYGLECKECNAKLAGIIDPNKEELLLSKLTGESAGGQRR
jgi:hypothetical protein